ALVEHHLVAQPLQQRDRRPGHVRRHHVHQARGHQGDAHLLSFFRQEWLRPSASAVRSSVRCASSASSESDRPQLGTIWVRAGRHCSMRCGNIFSSRPSMMLVAVEAPGEAPSMPPIEPSAAVISWVPNCSTPCFFRSGAITWTRWPAVTSSHCSGRAEGLYSSSASKRWWWVAASCEPRETMRSGLGGATALSWVTLEGLTDSRRAVQRPVLRNFGDEPASAPTISERPPATKRASEC